MGENIIRVKTYYSGGSEYFQLNIAESVVGLHVKGLIVNQEMPKHKACTMFHVTLQSHDFPIKSFIQ